MTNLTLTSTNDLIAELKTRFSSMVFCGAHIRDNDNIAQEITVYHTEYTGAWHETAGLLQYLLVDHACNMREID